MPAFLSFTCDDEEPSEPTGQSVCDEQPLFVDCDLDVIPVTSDAAGNPAIQFCPTPQSPVITSWNSNETETPSTPCVEGFYFDAATGCLSHLCSEDVLYPFCGGNAGTTELSKVCYDLSGLAESDFCWGGRHPVTNAETGWFVNGSNQFDNQICGSESTEQALAYPVEVLVNNTYNTNIGDPPPVGSIPGLFAGAVDTGQANGASTVVSASGSPTASPYFGSARPTMFVDFGLDANCVGPYKVLFDLVEAGGNIGVMLWDSKADKLLDITWAVAAAGTNVSVNAIPYGDWFLINSSNGVTGIMGFDTGTSGALTGDGVYLVLTAMGNSAGTSTGPVEELGNFRIEYTRVTSVGGNCCECLDSFAGVASEFNSLDPNNLTWVANGSMVCAQMPSDSLFDEYGAVQFCEGSVQPTFMAGDGNQPDPPVFTFSPPPEVCVDSLGTVCAECENGTVTAQKMVGGVWVDVL